MRKPYVRDFSNLWPFVIHFFALIFIKQGKIYGHCYKAQLKLWSLTHSTNEQGQNIGDCIHEFKLNFMIAMIRIIAKIATIALIFLIALNAMSTMIIITNMIVMIAIIAIIARIAIISMFDMIDISDMIGVIDIIVLIAMIAMIAVIDRINIIALAGCYDFCFFFNCYELYDY